MPIHSLKKVLPVVVAGLMLASAAHADLAPPKPEPFNFELVAKDPSADIKAGLKVDYYGSGLKDTKKFVIGAFQVRFRSSLTGEIKLNDRNCKGSLSDVYGLAENDTLYQKVTEDLYKQFVVDLKQRGIEVVNFEEMKKQPEFQSGIKKKLDSGALIELAAPAISNPFEKDAVKGRTPNSINKALGKEPTAYYRIFFPGEVPGFEYSGTDSFDEVVLPGTIPERRMEAAARIGAGVITVGFEVELIKYEYDACRIKSQLLINRAPMVRTRLTAFSAFPAGAKKSFSFTGGSISDGVVISPKIRGGGKSSGFLASMFNSEVSGSRWIEVEDDAVTIDYPTTTVIPVADKFPAAFKKSTTPHLQMIKYVLEHESVFK